MDYSKWITELRGRIKGATEFDTAKCDLYFREIQKEVVFRREQVTQLKQELQTVNGKLFEKTNELENFRSLLKEAEFNMNLAMKKAASVNEKYKSVNDSFVTLNLKEEMRQTENQMLNENLQKLSIENHRLSRENEENKNKLRYYNVSHQELEDKQMKLNAALTKIRENMEKLEKEQAKVIDVETLILTLEEYKKNCELSKEANEKFKKENIKLENNLIQMTGKYEKLHELIKSKAALEDAGTLEIVRYLQWKTHFKKLEEKNIAHEKIISTLTECLNQEVATNARLLLQNADYQETIEQLQSKLLTIKIIKEEEPIIELD